MFPHNKACEITCGLRRLRLLQTKLADSIVTAVSTSFLRAFELSDLAARKPGHLSGGQETARCSRSVFCGSETFDGILLFDEPTRGLDRASAKPFLQVLRKTRERLRVPLVLVTHDLEECFELADSVFLLDHGQPVQSGSQD